jgi:hypothetical protein
MASVRHDWYLREWIDASPVTITEFRERTGWTHRIASQLVNRRIRWNRDHLSEAAFALHVEPFELLMHPDEAFALRRLRADALRIAADDTQIWQEKPDDLPEWSKARAGSAKS